MAELEYPIKIYTYDIDYAGHVSNITYIRWLEQGRLYMMEEVGLPTASLIERGFMPVLVSTQIQYKFPLFLHDIVKAMLWISELKNASATIEHRIYNGDGKLCSEATQRGAFISAKTHKPYKLRSEERNLFERFLL